MDGRRFAGVSGDSAITRGDQIRKRNIYCRRRTRLSSFSEIICPEKREIGERDHLYGAREAFPRALDRKYVWGAVVTELNSISCSILKAAANKSEKKKLQNTTM